MVYVISPTQSDIQTAVRSLIMAVVPASIEVVAGLDNRVAEPQGQDFVVSTAIRRRRIETNVDTYADIAYHASISGTTLNVTSVIFQHAQIRVGLPVFGIGVADSTTIVALGNGTGGAGTYTVNTSQSVASEVMASGTALFEQPTEVTLQLDVHGPNSADYAEIISTLFRDGYAADFLHTYSNGTISPLYADDPRQMPFINAEQQYETRWIVEAVLQANQTISNVPQEFMDQVIIPVIDVENEYSIM